MSNTISAPNPDMIDLHSDVSMWNHPDLVELAKNNPAVEARAEYEQHLYAEALATPDVEATGIYTTNTGEAIDPQSAEAVLQSAADVVNAYDSTAPRHEAVQSATAHVVSAYDASPDAVAARERIRLTQEHHRTAVNQAGVYAPQIVTIRDRALIDWGAEGSTSLN